MALPAPPRGPTVDNVCRSKRPAAPDRHLRGPDRLLESARAGGRRGSPARSIESIARAAPSSVADSGSSWGTHGSETPPPRWGADTGRCRTHAPAPLRRATGRRRQCGYSRRQARSQLRAIARRPRRASRLAGDPCAHASPTHAKGTRVPTDCEPICCATPRDRRLRPYHLARGFRRSAAAPSQAGAAAAGGAERRSGRQRVAARPCGPPEACRPALYGGAPAGLGMKPTHSAKCRSALATCVIGSSPTLSPHLDTHV
jgi:hypothetical protein